MRNENVCCCFSGVKCVKQQTYFVVFESTKSKTSPTHGPPPQKLKLLVREEVEPWNKKHAHGGKERIVAANNSCNA